MWRPSKNNYAVAIYNWAGETRYGLPLEIGDTVQILEECLGWYRGFVTKNRSIKGIFPSSYVHVKPCKIENEGPYGVVVPLEDPVVREVTLILREWNCIWKNFYVARETYKFITLRKVMIELVEWRRQLLTGTLTQDQIRELKLKITSKIDWRNRKLGLDLVPRVGAEVVDPYNMSVVDLYRVHVQSSENIQASSVRGNVKKRESGKVLTHHLYLCMRDFAYFVGEDVEIYLSLYDAKKMKFISERFLVKISKEGFSNFLLKLHNNCTIFTDLGNGDLTRDLHLVAQVLRVGKMLYSDSSRKLTNTLSSQMSGSYNFKRPFGVGVLNINDMINSDNEEKEFTFRIYQTEDKDFYQLHDLIIRKQTSKFNPLSIQHTYGGIGISLKLLNGEFAKVEEEHPILFKNLCLTRKLGFPDVIMPGDVRNDLYVTIDRGEFERGGKSTSKNVEVTLMVLDMDGKPIENCIYGASGMECNKEYQSMILYHHNSPCWSETIRLQIPIEKYNVAHILLLFRHCSTRDKADNRKLFGFSFARLMELEGAILQDKTHELFVYHSDEKMKLNPSQYLIMASGSSELESGIIDTNPLFSCSHKEAVYIQTLLCSTKLTQNVDLLYLLQWRDQPKRIHEALTRALRLEGEELVKFLQDILDALFSMFSTEDGNSTTHSGLVFHVLVSIFNLLYDTKFEHFKPVMDAYIKGHFAAALVYKGLLTSVQHCAERATSTDKQEPIRKCFRSLEYIFKFIIESRILFSRATGGQFEDSFRGDVYSLFSVFNRMLSSTNDIILQTQIALLRSSSAVFDLLLQVVPSIEITRMAITMIDSLPTRDANAQLTQAKLAMIRDIVSSQLFKENGGKENCRGRLLLVSCKHLRYHLAHRDELRLCTDILSEILTFLYKEKTSGMGTISLHHDVGIVCLNTLDMLIQTIRIIMDRSAPVLGYLVCCLIGLLQLLDQQHYDRLWEEFSERKHLKEFLLRTFTVFTNLIKENIFPSDWLVMKMATNVVILTAMQHLALPLSLYYMESLVYFDCQLWTNYFNVAVEFLTQPSLQLEKFTEAKRTKITEKYGDMRVTMGQQILNVWSKLGEFKISFIPSMVGPFLEVTLVPEPQLRKATLNIFFDMMQCEQKSRGNFKQVESELIDKLDNLISENKGDDEYRQLFNTILLERVQTEDPKWEETGSAFINSVTRLLERLLDYRSVIQGDENRDKRMSCTVNLLNFYKNEIDRKEMYLRYIYKLHDLHLPADNFTEAAFTLKLYADSLSWMEKSPLVTDPRANNQPEWKRKEQLYLQIILYFDKGKCWEKGIPLCKDLAYLYECRLFDYSKLSHILQTQARFCDNILTQLRPEPEYFRVGFYGLSFPLFVRNKVFVYRGLEYERIEAFTQRLQMEFASAQILTKNTPPSHTVLQSDVQYIQICNVKPLAGRFPGNNDMALSEMPSKVARFYEVNDVCKFQLDRPMHKGVIDKDNEFKSLWLERTIMQTSSSLPGILRWFEIVNYTVEEVPPVKFACETMRSVNNELNLLISLYTNDPKRNINPLSMRLQGTIDANVMGGISKYQQAFFTQEFVENEPSYIPYVHQLHSLIKEQVDILENGLVVHGQLAPPGVQPLHHRLLERIAQLRYNLKKPPSMDTIINCPLPPIPKERTSLSIVDPEEEEKYPYTNSSYDRFENTERDLEQIYSEPMEAADDTKSNKDVRRTYAIKHNVYATVSIDTQSIMSTSDTVCKPVMRIASDRGSNPIDAPPLPPRLSERRTSGTIPPTPPKRTSIRTESFSSTTSEHRISDARLLRDSGFSDCSNNIMISAYDDFVLVPPAPPPLALLSPRSSIPPPLPPKIMPTFNNDDAINNTEDRNAVENYSMPKLQTDNTSLL